MHRRRWISTSSVQIEESAQVHNIFFSKESARVSDFRFQISDFSACRISTMHQLLSPTVMQRKSPIESQPTKQEKDTYQTI
jgi:hypothetical protein